MNPRSVLLVAALLVGMLAKAAFVDTITIYSQAMKKSIDCVVIRPSITTKKNISLPVVYLLHGWSGNHTNWITRVPALKQYADQLEILIVCPDGHSSSWYFDSPVDSTMRYETFISEEVPAWIDRNYTTTKSREARAITGLSMGGHGGLFIGFRHAGKFGACGSMSGAVDLGSFKSSYEISKRIGDTIKYANNWKTYSVMNLVETYPNDSLAIMVDCGTEDFFYQANRQLHDKLLRLKIPHDYVERPGRHDWKYWGNAVHYQLLFFRKYFDLKQAGRTK